MCQTLPTNNIPLVVDLDGTLLATDTLWEGIWCCMARQPLRAVQLLCGTISHGYLWLKERLLPYTLTGIGSYPLRPEVLDLLHTLAGENRPLVLATASPKPVAEAVAARLDIPFTTIFASGDGVNLRSQAKADTLVAHYGEKGFDYAGDSNADLPVWYAARTAIVVGKSALARARAANPTCTFLPVRTPCISDYLQAVRARHWVKNLLVFVPMLLAHDLSQFWTTALAFIGLCCCASGIYIFNDCCDLPNDRHHPDKKYRPFAAGILPLAFAPRAIILALLGTLSICLFLPKAYTICLLCYLIATLMYSLRLKQALFLDVIVLAGLYVLRIVAGAAAIGGGISPWLLAVAGFFFLGLALLKRIGGLCLTETKTLSGRAYTFEDLPALTSMAVASGFSGLVVVALYVYSLPAMRLYTEPEWLWAACPLLAYWYGRLVILARRGALREDPVDFSLHDRPSLVTALLLACTLLLAI